MDTDFDFGPPPMTDEEAGEALAMFGPERHEKADAPEIRPLAMDAEESVLGAALLLGDGPWPVECEALGSEDFTTPRRAAIWDAILGLRKRGEPVDEVTVWRAVRGETSATYVGQLVGECPAVMNLGHWARMVREAGKRRRFEAKMAELANSRGDPEYLRAEAARAAAELGEQQGAGGLVHVKAGLRGLMLSLEAGEPPPPLCRTGLRDVDAMLRMTAGRLTIAAGRPSMGKSALAGCVAAACAGERDKGAVAWFSLESPADEVAERLVKRNARSSKGDLARAVKTGDAGWLFQKVFELELFVDDRAGASLEQMRQALNALPKVRLVIVDYLQLCRLSEGRGDRRDLALGDLTKGLKAIAKERDCHVLALSQLNRSVEQTTDKEPYLSSLRDSGNLEEDADNVLLLYRREYYFPNEEASRGMAKIKIAKQRNGGVGDVQVAWVPERLAFEDLAKSGHP